MDTDELDANEVVRKVKKQFPSETDKNQEPISELLSEDDVFNLPDEIKPWRQKLCDILLKMDAYAF
jgi:hypothetical protein